MLACKNYQRHQELLMFLSFQNSQVKPRLISCNCESQSRRIESQNCHAWKTSSSRGEEVSFETWRVPPKVWSWKSEEISKGESPRCNEHPIFTAAAASQIRTEFNDQDSAVPFRVSKTIQEEYPHLEQGDPCNFILRGPHNLFVPTATKDLRRETIELQRKQTTL